MIDESQMQKLRTMKAMAEDSSLSEAEQELAREKLNQFMVKWGIESVINDASHSMTPEGLSRTVIRFDCPQVYQYAYAVLGVRVAKAMGLFGWLNLKWAGYGKPNKFDGACVAGTPDDLIRVGFLIQSLFTQCQQDLKKYQRDSKDSWRFDALSPYERIKDRESFIVAFCEAVTHRLREIRQEVVRTAPVGTDLVLVKRADMIKAWVHSDQNLTTTRTRNVTGTQAAWAAGQRAGQRAYIGQADINTRPVGMHALGS